MVWLVLLLFFIVLPVVEVALLVHYFNVWTTVGIIVLTGLVGTVLARHQGLAVLGAVQHDLAAGRLPAESLMDGVAVLAGAALLVTPGLLTDGLGLLLLIPPTRRRLRRWAQGAIQRRIRAGQGIVDVEYTVISDGE